MWVCRFYLIILMLLLIGRLGITLTQRSSRSSTKTWRGSAGMLHAILTALCTLPHDGQCSGPLSALTLYVRWS